VSETEVENQKKELFGGGFIGDGKPSFLSEEENANVNANVE